MMGKITFERLAKVYQQKYHATLVCVDASGEVVYGKYACGRRKCLPDCSACRRRAVFEALRWGEPSVNSCPQNYALWAIPLMENSHVYGGLVAVGAILEKDYLKSNFTSAQTQEACTSLRLLAEEENLTNAALLELNRRTLNRETEKALAIRALKTNIYDSIREIYLREEAALLAAELLSIESVGGKEVNDDALMYGDIEGVLFALCVLGMRDMRFLWERLDEIARRNQVWCAGDTACGFANTAMVMAERNMIPRVFAAVVRAASAVRSLVAYECGVLVVGRTAVMRISI